MEKREVRSRCWYSNPQATTISYQGRTVTLATINGAITKKSVLVSPSGSSPKAASNSSYEAMGKAVAVAEKTWRYQQHNRKIIELVCRKAGLLGVSEGSLNAAA
jgi:hypothetical protein